MNPRTLGASSAREGRPLSAPLHPSLLPPLRLPEALLNVATFCFYRAVTRFRKFTNRRQIKRIHDHSFREPKTAAREFLVTMAPFEQFIAYLTAAQLVVFAVGAFLAYQQFSAFRRQQEAQLVQQIFATLNEVEFAKALDFVYHDLQRELAKGSYVREIAEGQATVASHREFAVMHFFNGLGLLVHTKMVAEYPIVFIVASPCIRAWERLAPVIALLRRRYPHAYTPFESLVARSRAIDLTKINDRFRIETPQLRAQWKATARDLDEKRLVGIDTESG